ncbi:uncharacterized protein LOC123538789 [Mercenaria mercenaria]|uniref:uncharacterized protein LOC123538789 n=1 Tax=Mercenaria mercenaria TaxID=6596 RepID=UPI00234F46ED|nr:uncharacterized protein LOC123538789 [Mercenaria mercenaria]XP_045179103.2 uncharacterized protein LOC123538789 [Mercenaria mercenaria]XP_053385414.1 uncharacterized protein LOC123538789 [Mercenaria mercenaria]
MEVEDSNKNPESNFKYLVQQVEEQSDLCDMTVKRGLWEKKFHRCVLAACPFFENIIRGNFLEKQTGLVEVKVDTTPNAVEMALMFLYGRKPAFTIENVGELLELAEFFMLVGLKSACIEWLRSEEITVENCMHVMQLSTKYNFEVTTCIDYIESHLPEIFNNNDAVNLSKESIEYLFSDIRFSYLTMDEKLTFLVKWAGMHSCEKAENVRALFQTIDMEEVSNSALESAKRNVPFSKIIDLNKVVLLADDESSKRNVLILFCNKGYFWCLDLLNFRWYRLNSSINENQHLQSCDTHEIGGVRNLLPEIYITCKRGFLGKLLPTLLIVNLETNQTTTYQLNLGDEDITETKLSSISLTDDTMLATVNKTIQVIEVFGSRQSEGENDRRPDYPVSTSRDQIMEQIDHNSVLLTRRIQAPYDCDIGELLSSIPGDSPKHLNVTDIGYSEVYFGRVSDETVELEPLFSLRNEEIIDTCVSSQSTVALLTKSMQYVIIFDIVDLKTEKHELKPDANYKIAHTGEGFLIYNNTRCYCFKRLSGPSLLKKYLIQIMEFENENSCIVRYRYCNDIWIRIVHNNDDFQLQYVSHKEISVSKIPRDINWKQLPLPDEIKIIDKLMNESDRMFVVALSKHRLRCDIACPHCKLADRPNIGLDYFLNGFLLDSSDDEYVFQNSSDSESE